MDLRRTTTRRGSPSVGRRFDRRDLATLEVPPLLPRPCLEEGERERMEYLQSQPGMIRAYRISDPCVDCLAGFAAEMRLEGKCDGTPKGDEHLDELLEVGVA